MVRAEDVIGIYQTSSYVIWSCYMRGSVSSTPMSILASGNQEAECISDQAIRDQGISSQCPDSLIS
jgi:hypothetical protein